jgi:tRNA G10  N-methylase Trm11
MFYFDKRNPAVLFCDNRAFSGTLCDGRKFEVNPDMFTDVTALPFDDETFYHVVLDPPHLLHTAGDNSWLVTKYGKLPRQWEPFIRAAFSECWRVLKTNGTLIFKWSEDAVKLGAIVGAIGREPLYGQRGNSKTHWLVYVKTSGDYAAEQEETLWKTQK